MIKKVLAPNGTCLTLQNGMGNVDILQDVLGENRVLQGSTSQAAMISKAGSVEHTGIGYIKIASPTEVHFSSFSSLLGCETSGKVVGQHAFIGRSGSNRGRSGF